MKAGDVFAYLLCLFLGSAGLIALGEQGKSLIAPPIVSVPEFDAAQCITEGRFRITPTDRRDHDRPPLKLVLPITNGMPAGAKLVRVFFSDVSQSWCAVVTHASYLKVSPAGVVPVMTRILKVDE